LRGRWQLVTLLALSLITLSGGGPALAQSAAEPAPSWRLVPPVLPGAASIWLRGALSGPPSVRVWWVPGSGCPGFMPSGQAWLNAWPDAEIRVLQKPGIDATGRCAADFPRHDRLRDWAHAARLAIQSAATSAQPLSPLPTLLVGLSEGGEILAALAPTIEGLSGVLLIASPGLDPQAWAADQAAREHDTAGWRELLAQASSAAPDDTLLDGRSLGYWRDLLQWHQQANLLALPVPLARVWGEHDERIPPSAYARFAALAAARNAGWCDWSVPSANHALQGPEGDGIARLISRLSAWSRRGAGGSVCAAWP
jgi:hypothetical protein